ncbi:MAG: iron ABC transporter permease [Chloroflexi bacterium]|nr:MAG: iron ABC transporter permease [Chloroflexota bacterium]
MALAPARRRGHLTIRTRAFDVRINVRVLLLAAGVTGVLALLATWAMTLGSYPVPYTDVFWSLLGRGNEEHEFIVRTLRVPRVLCAIGIGGMLALSGAIFQGLVRNPLVSPDIIGIESGATLFAVFWLVTGRGWGLLPFAAFGGAFLTAALIYVLSWKGGVSPNRLILVGIGIGSCAAAGTTYLTVRYPVEIVRPAQVWTMGSVYGSDWGDVRVLGVAIAFLLPLAVGLTWSLRTLQLGEDVSRGLGMPLERTRLLLILTGCALSAVTISIAGPIGFVALMTPHLARMLAGPLSGSMMLLTGALGATFLLAADVVAQHALPVALPVGVITSAVGAPYFLLLLYRANIRM